MTAPKRFPTAGHLSYEGQWGITTTGHGCRSNSTGGQRWCSEVTGRLVIEAPSQLRVDLDGIDDVRRTLLADSGSAGGVPDGLQRDRSAGRAFRESATAWRSFRARQRPTPAKTSSRYVWGAAAVLRFRVHIQRSFQDARPWRCLAPTRACCDGTCWVPSTPESREDLEARLFSDDRIFSERLSIAEDELVSDYVQSALTDAERQDFEKHFLCTDERRAKLEFARALHAYAERSGRLRAIGRSQAIRHGSRIALGLAAAADVVSGLGGRCCRAALPGSSGASIRIQLGRRRHW